MYAVFLYAVKTFYYHWLIKMSGTVESGVIQAKIQGKTKVESER